MSGEITLSGVFALYPLAVRWGAKEIAALRNVSEATVTTHRKNIYRKLEVNNSQEAAKYALRTGLMEASDYFI